MRSLRVFRTFCIQHSTISIRTMRWQKTARLAIVAFVIVFAGVVLFTMRQRRATPQAPVPEIARSAADDAAVYNPSGVDYKETADGKLVFRLQAKRHWAYPDGRQKLEEVAFTLPDREGKTIVIKADKAEVTTPPDKQIGTANFTGNVRLTTNDGIEVTAATAVYDDASGVMTVPGPVEFTRGRMKGTGIGATYDKNRDVLWLLDRAHITLAPDAAGLGAADATSGAAGLARAENYVRLTRDARIVSDGRTITADDVTALLQADGNSLEQVQLRGNSRITESGANARNMSARDIDLTYAPDGRTMQSARLMDNGVVDLPGPAGEPGRRISGRSIDMTMGPDGSTLTTLNATENVEVDLPGQGETPAKRIRAAALRASGPPETGLQAAAFGGQVEYHETRAAAGKVTALDRTARSQRLVIATKAGLGDVEQADFRGHFRFTDDEVTAQAPRALYHVARDRIELSPFEKEPGPTPFVNDGRSLIEARNIQLSPESEKVTADTDVRSTLQPKRAGTAAEGSARSNGEGGQARMPVMLEQDRPVYVASNNLSYDGVSEATYSGNARLWQDQSQSKIDAGTIVLNDRTGNLTARTNVSTTMLMEDVDPKTKEKTLTLTVATANQLVYDDEKRLAVYTGTPERQAHMKGVHGDVVGDRIDVYLQESGSELERAEARGSVTVKEGARVATGSELIYTASNDTYVMKGSPVVAIEREAPNSCKKIVGTTLTFQRSVGSISADAAGMVPVKSEPVPCPAESRN
jgi:LPS export ABC transporter protein LptC